MRETAGRRIYRYRGMQRDEPFIKWLRPLYFFVLKKKPKI